MSRSWLDACLPRSPRLRAYIGGRTLALCRRNGRTTEQQQRAYHKTSCLGETREDILTIYDDWLAGEKNSSGIEWLLGLALVRYVLLPWSPACIDPAIRDAAARALYREQFQEDPARFSPRFTRARYGQPQLAAFVEREVVSRIETICKRHGQRISAITPTLARVWDEQHRVLQREVSALRIVEEQRVLWASNDHGHISAIAVRPTTFSTVGAGTVEPLARHGGAGGAVRAFEFDALGQYQALTVS